MSCLHEKNCGLVTQLALSAQYLSTFLGLVLHSVSMAQHNATGGLVGKENFSHFHVQKMVKNTNFQ